MEQTLDSMPTRKEGKFEKRIHEIDLLRGFSMLLVFFDHLMWNFSYYFSMWGGKCGNQALIEIGKLANLYWTWSVRYIVQFVVLCLFVLLSGISTAFSRDNWKRSGQMTILWFLLFVGSNIVNAFMNSGSVINFNVIGVIGFSVLFYCLVQKKSWKMLIACILICFLLYKMVIPWLFWETGDKATLAFPLWSDWTYSKTYGTNFYNPKWLSEYNVGSVIVNGKTYLNADYMPLFPYIIAFFIGAFLAKTIYSSKKSLVKHRGEWERPICFIGRHSLIFYLTHQLVFMGIFMAIGAISGLGL